MLNNVDNITDAYLWWTIQTHDMCEGSFTSKYTLFQQVPDYYNIVNHPMDLSTIRDNLRQKKYQSREEFLSDISQIVENSKLYNGKCTFK